MIEKTGWMCPQCNKAHGPHVDTCPGEMVIKQPTSTPPMFPSVMWPEISGVTFPPNPFITTCSVPLVGQNGAGHS